MEKYRVLIRIWYYCPFKGEELFRKYYLKVINSKMKVIEVVNLNLEIHPKAMD